ncbi:MAG: cobyrinate a,c-diamide synthase [Clostridium sp.]|nr:cobyrinate a,c-diamide synthase [Clostridium sp.]
MKVNRIMIAAPKSGSGKTTITCALLKALKNRGKNVIACKCGPDYIDPMFHEKALGVPSANLDTFFTGAETTRELFAKHAAGAKAEIAVLEGVMGLYDGLGGIREEGSSYHLAKVTGTPIVLAADVKGMGYSILPLLAGFLAYDTEHLVKGVILNKISKGMFETIKPLIKDRLGLSVLGFLTEQSSFQLESRHLGLVMPGELAGIEEKLAEAAEAFEKTVSVSGILEIAENVGELDGGAEVTGCVLKERGFGDSDGTWKKTDSSILAGRKADSSILIGRRADSNNWQKKVSVKDNLHWKTFAGKKPVIAVARDEAFFFYYKENIFMLEENGANIKYFSPLHDKKLPEGCHGILLGGGYPELYAEKLSKNESMRKSIREAAKEGMPIVAECGGFMYLHSALTDKAGIKYAMAGVIPAECFDAGKLVRFGYVEIREKESNFLPENGTIKGHEFHYYDSADNGSRALAVKPVTGKGYPCIAGNQNCWMGFPHLYYPSNPAFAEAFVEKARMFATQTEAGVS